jgi:hypothetical protein
MTHRRRRGDRPSGGRAGLHLDRLGRVRHRRAHRGSAIAYLRDARRRLEWRPNLVSLGFFGQNFGWLVDHIDAFLVFLVFGIGSVAASCAVLSMFFRHTAMTGDDRAS